MDDILGSLNVRGLRDRCKRIALYEYFKDCKLKVICVQDTHSTEDVVEAYRRDWDGESVWNHGTSRIAGTGILIKIAEN